MLPTPQTPHISFVNIYEPAEDTFLFLDTLSCDTETSYLKDRFSDPLARAQSTSPFIVEIGTGSGVVLAFLAANAKAILGRSDILTLGTDLNSFACAAATETVVSHVQNRPDQASPGCSAQAGFLGVVNTDLASSIRYNSIDVLLFNPPYVPSEDYPTISSLSPSNSSLISRFERDSQLLALATDGGVEGMEITNQVIYQLPSLLNEDRGVAYILLCAQNKPEEVKERIKKWDGNWKVETVGRSGKKAGWEKLQIVRIARSRH